MSNKGILVVLSGPSGTGKTTLSRALLKLLPEMQYSISATTRPQRPGEENGKDYFFLSESEFKEKKNKGEFLETAKVFGHWYGTPRSFFDEKLNEGKDVLLDIDVQGALSVRNQVVSKKKSEGIFILVVPPSIEVLSQRLQKRNTDSQDMIDVRLNKARKEIQSHKLYNYVVVNDVIEECLQHIKSILLAEKCLISRNLHFLKHF